MKALSATLLAIALVSALAACGGGGKRAPSIEEIRELTGLSAPAETPEAQRVRAPDIEARADSLILSTVHGETSLAEVPTFRLESRCSGTRCAISESSIGLSDTIELSDLEPVEGAADAIGTRYGITLMSQTAELMDARFVSFGAWMEHGAFAVQTEDGTLEGTRISARYAAAGGDLTGAAPAGSATWLGLMVGTPATGSSRGERLQGVAALNYDMNAGGGLDVAFSSITNIERGTAHSTATVIFADVPIGPGGTFETGVAGNRIQGGFYGPGHAEAAGIFEQSNIVGAFGATLQ